MHIPAPLVKAVSAFFEAHIAAGHMQPLPAEDTARVFLNQCIALSMNGLDTRARSAVLHTFVTIFVAGTCIDA